MIKRIGLIKLMASSLLLLLAFVTPSCAQQPKKAEPTTTKEQTKTVIMQKVKMSIDGMSCSACQSNVKKTIKSIDGVTDVEVNCLCAIIT